MAGSSLTIAETITEIRSALQDYIEATYHIGDPALVKQRRVLLDEEGIGLSSSLPGKHASLHNRPAL
jgi:hypothetical protein